MRNADQTPFPATDPARTRSAQRATWVSVAVNLALTFAQLLVGWIAHSQSLIAHGLHSFSDLLSDFLVLWATAKGAAPADADHPYGHGRLETAATLILGVSLMLIGGAILWDAGLRLQAPAALPAIEWLALWIAILTVVAKEGLYHYLIRVARQQRSRLLEANALHTRADAASALVVVAGIAGALLGFAFLDLLAAALMGFMILRMGGELAWHALRELVDTGLEADQVAGLRETLLATPGVLDVHDLRTRRMAHHALVDVHLRVAPRISVSEGHWIAETARANVLQQHPDIQDVLTHIDPEDDPGTLPASRQPGRAEVLRLLAPWLTGLPAPEQVVLHYLGGKIDVDLHFCAEADSLSTLKNRLSTRPALDPRIGKVRLFRNDAP